MHGPGGKTYQEVEGRSHPSADDILLADRRGVIAAAAVAPLLADIPRLELVVNQRHSLVVVRHNGVLIEVSCEIFGRHFQYQILCLTLLDFALETLQSGSLKPLGRDFLVHQTLYLGVELVLSLGPVFTPDAQVTLPVVAALPAALPKSVVEHAAGQQRVQGNPDAPCQGAALVVPNRVVEGVTPATCIFPSLSGTCHASRASSACAAGISRP